MYVMNVRELFQTTDSSPQARVSPEVNRLIGQDRPAHDWYRFVLSFPPHLVREYIGRFELTSRHRVLDPFCGTGTTAVECKKQGIPSVGVEAHPMAHFAGATKINWSVDAESMEERCRLIADVALLKLGAANIVDDPQLTLLRELPDPPELRTLSPERESLLLANSISPLPLHKTLILLDLIRAHPAENPHLLLALAKALVGPIGNLHFGPEVGVSPPKADAAVVSTWLDGVLQIAGDIRTLRRYAHVPSVIHHADSRSLSDVIEPESIDAVITSPPYPNEKDYTRTTRLESVLLGFISSKKQLQDLKRTMLRSNTRGVYKTDTDDAWVAGHKEIQRIAAAIEARRIELGKTSGFERMYARVTKLYFGGMARHLADLRPLLRPNAQLAYVVGDQASYLRVMIRTGQILSSIAEELGYEVVAVELFRTRLSTASKEQLREEIVILRWPGTR